MKDSSENWFEYDWQVEGIPALFTVDLSLFDTAQGSPFIYMFYVSCMTKDGREFSRVQLIKLGLMLKKLQKLMPVYAGSIETQDQHQLYFYGDEPGVMAELEALCAKNKDFECRAGLVKEPDWRTYMTLLYPDECKSQTEINRENIELYESKGDCITAPRRINMSFFFPTEALLMDFTEQARQTGFAVGKSEFASDSELPHGVVLYCLSSLEKRKMDRLTTRMIKLAAKYGGKLVYWNCQLVRKKPPLA